MKDSNLIGPWIRRFIVEYLVVERNLSKNTQKSYRDTLSLLLPFIAKREEVCINKVLIEHLSIDSIRDFFDLLRNKRSCSARTCNQRLAAIHVFAQFISWKSPEHVAWGGQMRSIPFKKTGRTVIPYLERSEVEAILSGPNMKTWQGLRDHAVLLFMYNTGARASELADLTIADLDMKYSQSVKILGKGSKVRHCPLWQQTIAALAPITIGRSANEKLFLNVRKQSLTRFGIHTLVERYYIKAKKICPSLEKKRASPHIFRHTTAVHLLRSGVDINTIRAWLGHVSIDTTNIYAEVDLEMKTKALALCKVPESKKNAKTKQHWKENADLMTYLRSI